MKGYLKTRVWDWLLCCCIAFGLTMNMFSGFVLTDWFSPNMGLVAVTVAAALLVLTLLAFNQKSMIGGIIGSGVLLVALVAGTRLFNVFEEGTPDATTSLFISLTVTLLCVLTTYFATRTRAGSIVLLVVGNLAICIVHFLMFDLLTWWFMLFLVACMVMIWYRNYVITAKTVQTGQVRLPRYMLQTLVLCAVAFSLGCGVFYGIIAPLNPPKQDLRLIEELVNNEVIQKSGLYTTNKVLDPDLASSGTQNDRQDASPDKEQDDGKRGGGEEEAENLPEHERQKQQEQQQTPLQEVSYDLQWLVNIPWFWIILALLLVAAVVAFMLARRRWFKKVEGLATRERIVNQYKRMCKGLKTAGYRRAGDQTLRVWADGINHQMEPYAHGGLDFKGATDIYARTIYAHEWPTPEEMARFKGFWEKFHKTLRKDMGTFKYVLNLWRI